MCEHIMSSSMRTNIEIDDTLLAQAMALRNFHILPIFGPGLASLAARNYRALRNRGITIIKTPDLIVGTVRIAQGHRLLPNNRDFDPLATHLGLMIA